MSEQEFNLYLKLLSRCLGLTSRQREQIADELRDHLAERLEELAAAGVSREQAVLQALDEFGDAAVLAGHFTTIARLKRRRFLMRLSLGSVALLVAALFVAFAFWPDNHAIQGPPHVFAQNKSETKAATKAPASALRQPERAHEPPNGWGTLAVNPRVFEHPLSSDIGQNPRIEVALEQKVDFTIEPEPLKDALDFIAQRYSIPIMLDSKVLEDASVDTSAEVKLPYTGMKLRQMLNLLLQQGSQPMSYAIEDGVLRISTVEQIRSRLYVVVYDCRDLIHMKSMDPHSAKTPQSETTQAAAATEGGGMFSTVPDSAETARQFGGGSGGPAKNKKAERPAKTRCAGDDIPLIRVIKYSVDASDWAEEPGDGPSITEIGGLLVVSQNALVHEQIRRVLADLRRMRKEGAFAAFDSTHTAPAAASPPAGKSGL
jgi:HAAS domain-containing protein